ncbi:hypothetical protein HKX48_000605 [Thoreauomyces humboldtii]|nr:hypothetical protein HKX48_000605 [Thoreauomyces humboldtii]
MICYLDTDVTQPYAAKFVELFSPHGFIPNVSMRIYRHPKPDWKVRYFLLCSGIGVAELAIHRVFPKAVCVGYSEINPTALAIYAKHFPDHRNFGDAMQIDPSSLPDFDLLVGGVPCQPFSMQSVNRQNFTDQRSSLFHVFTSILKEKAPRDFILENVPMETNTRQEISQILKIQPVELDANIFTAQNRKRLFWSSWHIPQAVAGPSPRLIDIIDKKAQGRQSSFKDLPKKKPSKNFVAAIRRNTKTKECSYRTDNKAPTLTTNNCYQTVVAVGGRFRHYTIKERERLQGLPDGYTKLDQIDLPNTRICLGNAMNFKVMEYIFRQL